MTSHKMFSPLLFSGALALSACGGGDSGTPTGQVSVGVTDAPVDEATAVMMTFDGIELKPADGQRLVFPLEAAGPINVLDLQNGAREMLLEGITVPAGRYNYIRLSVAEDAGTSPTIEFQDGSVFPLTVPSSEESGLKLNQGFVVPVNGLADFTVDIDLRRSIHEVQGGLGTEYIMRPTLRMVQTNTTGSISGTVDATLASAPDCDAAVYVYEGSGVTPDDLGSAVEPVTSADVTMDETTGEYHYNASYLVEGAYTVALTCAAAADAPDIDDDIPFEAQADVNVVAGESAALNF